MGKIVIAQTLVTIPEKAFYAMPTLQSITIPDTVSEIGDNAFAESSNLDTIYCYPAVPPKCGKNIFNGIGSNTIVHVLSSTFILGTVNIKVVLSYVAFTLLQL